VFGKGCTTEEAEEGSIAKALKHFGFSFFYS
jgi:hypothetical protein